MNPRTAFLALLLLAFPAHGAEPDDNATAPDPALNVVTEAALAEGNASLADNKDVRWDFYKAAADGSRSNEHAGGSYGGASALSLPPGRYVASARIGNIVREIPFAVTPGETARPAVIFEAGRLTVVPKYAETDPQATSEARVELRQGAFEDGAYGQQSFYVPAGDITVTARIGPATAERTVRIQAGETLEEVIAVGAGVLAPAAVYTEGGPPVDSEEIRFDVLSGKAELDGTRRIVIGTYGPGKMLTVPAGEHVLSVRLGSVEAEVPVSVTAGQRTETTVTLNAGVLAVSAPGARRIDILSAAADIQGVRREISGTSAAAFQDTLPEGDYAVRAAYEGDRQPQERTATVKAGERTEITID